MSRGRLPVGEGFRQWAPTYELENPLTRLDCLVTERLAPAPPGGALLEVGCGTARRLPAPDTASGPALVVGVDLVPAMLAQGRQQRAAGCCLVAATVDALPLRPAIFDVAWCRLAIGFMARLEAAFASLAAQLQPDGRLLITDLHPDLVAEGAERGFRAEDGAWQVIEALAHPVDHLIEAASGAGLELVDRNEPAVGPELEELYRSAGREDLYHEHSQRPVLVALLLRKP